MSVVFHNPSQVINPYLLHDRHSHIHHHTDIKIRKQTEAGLANRAPSIKQMAIRYNSLVDKAQEKAVETNFPLHLLPQPLDISQLYNVDANLHMWMVDTIPTADVAQLPPYLVNDDVRRGIASILVQDRVKEEIFRLREEYHNMIKWLEVRIQSLRTTIGQCHGVCQWVCMCKKASNLLFTKMTIYCFSSELRYRTQSEWGLIG